MSKGFKAEGWVGEISKKATKAGTSVPVVDWKSAFGLDIFLAACFPIYSPFV